MPDHPLNALELEERLDELLWAALSSRRTASQAAAEMAGLSRDRQEYVLHWVEVIEKSNSECAFQFATHARRAFQYLDTSGVESWIEHAMDVYDGAGLYPAVDVFREVRDFRERLRAARVGVALDSITGILQRFVLGLSGRPLSIAASDAAYTDTETLFLPRSLSVVDNPTDNFRLYKAQSVLLWAQTRYGTWRLQALDALERYPDSVRCLELYLSLETLRLTARVERELPGVYREMRGLCEALGQEMRPVEWDGPCRNLARPGAGAGESLALLASLYESGAPAVTPFLCGTGYPDQVRQVTELRLAKEKNNFRIALAHLKDELAGKTDDDGEDGETDTTTPFSLRRVVSESDAEGSAFELLFEGKPLSPPEDVAGTLQSILLDLGELPDDYLVPAGEGAYSREDTAREEDPSADAWSGVYHEKGAHLYNEWDFRRQHYRKGWCVLREVDLESGGDAFVVDTLRKYAHHLVGLRKTFEALRGDDKRLKKEPNGDEVDIDALIEALADSRTGMEMTDRLFTRVDKVERNIAVMFMVDMSGSTQGWINQAERESLVLLCEALDQLGDRYAIYGFSGMTRKRCEVYRIKRFSDRYDETVKGRITHITPRDYTRMGVAIRHLCRLLNEVEAKTRILVTLSDGKPDDYGADYRGEYGIEDTRRALIEAKRDGIHPFCITIDREGQDYLPHMYGPVNYTIVDAVEKLPYKVSEIYRRLTT